MPRLNNQDETIVETYGLTVTWNDPGQDLPVDLCWNCASSWLDAGLFIEHPSYEDDEYNCLEYGAELDSADD
jgi:hypothetical protein